MSETTKLRDALQMSAQEFQDALHHIRRTGLPPGWPKKKAEQSGAGKSALEMTPQEWQAALRSLK